MFRQSFAAVVAVLCWTLPAAAAPPCSVAGGQQHIDAGQYQAAVNEFTCVINAAPTEVEGYRGRIEALLLLQRFSDAVRDYARVTALVEPVHPDAATIILSGYGARLAADPSNVAALTGMSFAHWWYFAYAQAIQRANDLLSVTPGDLYATLFRGSSRMLGGNNHAAGAADLDTAIALAPASPDVRFVVADAYTYGQPDAARARAEATLALEWGLDTPRVRAILGAAENTLGHPDVAAAHVKLHIGQVTLETITTAPLTAGSSRTVPLLPYRTFDMPLPVSAGESVKVSTFSNEVRDTILVLLAPDGSPVLGADDVKAYLAAFEWTAPASGMYKVRVTSFEGVGTGALKVTRQ